MLDRPSAVLPIARAAAAALSQVDVPKCSISTAITKTAKAKPTERIGTSSLTYRQLAAARMLVRGKGSTEIAARLRVSRQTVARWKRNPAFVAELDRFLGRLTRAASTPVRRAL